jgi:putative copper resistance protein D
MDEPASVTSLLIFARALYFGSGMMLVSAAVFGSLIPVPVGASASGQAWLKRFQRRLRAIFLTAAALLATAAVLWFWAAAAGMSGTSLRAALDSATMSTVLFQTRFGTVCEVRTGLFVLLAVLAWHDGAPGRWSGHLTRKIQSFMGLTAMALLASVAWTGHAGAAGGAAFPWTLIADSIHLLAAAIWPAGLLFFAWILSSGLSQQNPMPLSSLIVVARRFSAVSLAAVVVLAMTGFIDTFFLVHSFRAMVDTAYGRVLCLKITVFLIMLAIAAGNRFRLLPQLGRAIHAPAPAEAISVVSRLRRFVRLEVGLAAGIVLIVAFLGMLSPAAH